MGSFRGFSFITFYDVSDERCFGKLRERAREDESCALLLWNPYQLNCYLMHYMTLKESCKRFIGMYRIGRRGSLMVSALDSGASAPGSSPGRGHCVVFLGKTLHSQSASLHPGVQMGTGKLLGKT